MQDSRNARVTFKLTELDYVINLQHRKSSNEATKTLIGTSIFDGQFVLGTLGAVSFEAEEHAPRAEQSKMDCREI